MVGAGEYRHPVIVEQQSLSRGESGEKVDTWTTFATLRCRIWPGKGTEATESLRETGTTPTRFFSRFVPGIVNGMRLVFSGRYYDIVNVCNVGERNRELEISAVEKT
jgi:head-tail adaptor